MRIDNSSREADMEKWLELRRTGITGTEIGKLYAKKTTIDQLWHEKHDAIPIPDNPYMQWGRERENIILEWLRAETGLTITDNSDIWSADDNPRYLSTPDGVGDGFVAHTVRGGQVAGVIVS